MAYWNIDPDLEEDEDEAEATSTRRKSRSVEGTDIRPVALRKCPRCGHYYADMFFQYEAGVCRLCVHEAENPLTPTRLAKGA